MIIQKVDIRGSFCYTTEQVGAQEDSQGTWEDEGDVLPQLVDAPVLGDLERNPSAEARGYLQQHAWTALSSIYQYPGLGYFDSLPDLARKILLLAAGEDAAAPSRSPSQKYQSNPPRRDDDEEDQWISSSSSSSAKSSTGRLPPQELEIARFQRDLGDRTRKWWYTAFTHVFEEVFASTANAERWWSRHSNSSLTANQMMIALEADVPDMEFQEGLFALSCAEIFSKLDADLEPEALGDLLTEVDAQPYESALGSFPTPEARSMNTLRAVQTLGFNSTLAERIFVPVSQIEWDREQEAFEGLWKPGDENTCFLRVAPDLKRVEHFFGLEHELSTDQEDIYRDWRDELLRGTALAAGPFDSRVTDDKITAKLESLFTGQVKRLLSVGGSTSTAGDSSSFATTAHSKNLILATIGDHVTGSVDLATVFGELVFREALKQAEHVEYRFYGTYCDINGMVEAEARTMAGTLEGAELGNRGAFSHHCKTFCALMPDHMGSVK